MATESSTPYSLLPIPCTIDILAIAAHRDDVEQTCGGTLLAMHARGWRTGILDLTQGESGTRGTAAERAAEAADAARILNVAHREALDLPDGNVQNTYENRLKIAAVLRRLRPRVVILPYWQGRHPDHYTSATLGYEACFVSGLAKVETPGGTQPAASSLQNSLRQPLRRCPPHLRRRHNTLRRAAPASLLAYRSQYASQSQGSKLFVPEEEIRERTFSEARHYGLLAGVRYAEPFVQKEIGLVDDIALLPVQSI